MVAKSWRELGEWNREIVFKPFEIFFPTIRWRPSRKHSPCPPTWSWSDDRCDNVEHAYGVRLDIWPRKCCAESRIGMHRGQLIFPVDFSL